MVSFTVDPTTDTPEVLKKYQDKHGADATKWFFLAAPDEQLKKLLVDGFKLGTMEKPEFHTGKFVLIDGERKIRGYYDTDIPASFTRLRTDIAQLLK